MKSKSSVIGKNSTRNEASHEAHGRRGWEAIKDFNRADSDKEATRIFNRITRYYPEMMVEII